MTDAIWTKELGRFTLLEYPKEPNLLSCTVTYEFEEEDLVPGDDESITFAFGSWGCDRELITEEDCFLCCKGMQAYDANVSISSFGANLEYIRAEVQEVDEDE